MIEEFEVDPNYAARITLKNLQDLALLYVLTICCIETRNAQFEQVNRYVWPAWVKNKPETFEWRLRCQHSLEHDFVLVHNGRFRLNDLFSSFNHGHYMINGFNRATKISINDRKNIPLLKVKKYKT